MGGDDVVLGVTLGGGESRVADEPTEDWFVEAVCGARGGNDIFFHHDRAHIVGAELESDLPDVRAHGDPARADRVDIVEH